MPKLNPHDTIFNMKWTQKRKLVVLMTFHMLWGLVLWFSISKYGLGISTDSMQLLFSALNLSQGKGLYSFDGSFVSLWPPLYPMLLAFDSPCHTIRSICFSHHFAGRWLLLEFQFVFRFSF